MARPKLELDANLIEKLASVDAQMSQLLFK